LQLDEARILCVGSRHSGVISVVVPLSADVHFW
jgi:hypothetical protein